MKTITLNVLKMKTLLLLITIMWGAKTMAQVTTDHLNGYWPLEGNALDLSGNGNNGTVNGATLTTDRFGRTDGAYQFSNASQRITIPSSSTARLAKPFSISLWCYNNGGSRTLFRKGSEWGIDLDGGTSPGAPNRIAFFSLNSPSSVNTFYSPSTIPNNTWVHIAAVFDNTSANNVSLYVDNVLVLTATGNPASYSSSTDITAGGFFDEPFYGKIDDIRIYSKALTPTEVDVAFHEQTTPIVNLGADKTTCLNQPVTISGINNLGSTYQWYKNGVAISGATSYQYVVSATVAETATYSLTETNAYGNSATDDIVVTSIIPTVTITGETLVCSGLTTILDAGAGFASYTWSNGATTPSINAGAGSYSVTVVDANGCTANSSLTVQNSTTCTTMNPTSCGKNFSTINDNIYCVPVSGAISYDFIFDELNDLGQVINSSTAINKTTYYINLKDVSMLHYYGKFQVRVRAKYSSGMSAFSAPCNFTINAESKFYYACPTDKYIYNNLNGIMTLSNVYGATKYNVTLINVADNSVYTSVDYITSSTSTSCAYYPLSSFTGLNYNGEYIAKIKVYVPCIENGIPTYRWSDEVTGCVNVKIDQPRNTLFYACPTDKYIYNNQNDIMTLSNVYGATKYNVTLIRTSDNAVFTSTDYTTSATSTSCVYYPLSSFSNLTYNSEYIVKVKTFVPIYKNGVAAYDWSDEVTGCVNVKINQPRNTLFYACPTDQYIYNNLSGIMTLSNVYGATKYNVTLIRTSDNAVFTSTDYTTSATSTSCVYYSLSSFSNLTYNSEYIVKVKTFVPIYKNGVAAYDWSDEVTGCTNVVINGGGNRIASPINTSSDNLVLLDENVSVTVYPNPSKGEFMVSGLNSEKAEVKIMDVTGRIVFEGIVIENQNINLSNEAKGIYFIMLQTETGVATKRIILE